MRKPSAAQATSKGVGFSYRTGEGFGWADLILSQRAFAILASKAFCSGLIGPLFFPTVLAAGAEFGAGETVEGSLFALYFAHLASRARFRDSVLESNSTDDRLPFEGAATSSVPFMRAFSCCCKDSICCLIATARSSCCTVNSDSCIFLMNHK